MNIFDDHLDWIEAQGMAGTGGEEFYRPHIRAPARPPKKPSTLQLGQGGDFFQTGDMLDPTISASVPSQPPLGVVVLGSGALVIVVLLAFKRVFHTGSRRHTHTAHDPLLPSANA